MVVQVRVHLNVPRSWEVEKPLLSSTCRAACRVSNAPVLAPDPKSHSAELQSTRCDPPLSPYYKAEGSASPRQEGSWTVAGSD